MVGATQSDVSHHKTPILPDSLQSLYCAVVLKGVEMLAVKAGSLECFAICSLQWLVM